MNPPKQPNQIRKMVIEDTGSEEMADALVDHLQVLKRWPTPTSSDEIQSLLNRLSSEMRGARHFDSRWAWLTLRSQLRVISKELWAASALVILIGTLVSFVAYQPEKDTFAPLVIFAPVVTAIGVALLYDAEYELCLEIEDATPAGVMLLLLARLLLIFGFNLAFTLCGSVLLSLVRAEISLGGLILAWLLPMTFLSALAFLMSVALRSTALSVTTSMVIWSVHVFLTQATPSQELIYALSMPGLREESGRPLLLVASIVSLLAALVFVEKSDRPLGVAP